MSAVPRNAPCPCNSGLKYKKCCLPRDEASRSAPAARTIESSKRTFLASHGKAPSQLVDAHAWPVETVYVPIPEVWQATGLGTVAVARRRPDGRLAYAVFLLNLSEHGISGVFGKDDAPPGAKDSFLDDLREMIPPMQEGSLADASLYVYGAIAVAEEQDASFPPDEIGPFLDLLPPPPGAATQWRDGLIGPSGHTPAGLLRVLGDLPADVDIPSDKEIAVFTEMEFQLPEAGVSLASASAKFPWFGDQGGASWFHYTPVPMRTQPRQERSGKVQGQVQMRGDRVVAIAFTLSMAARLMVNLNAWLGSGIKLASVRWSNSVTKRSETVQIDRFRSLSGLQGSAYVADEGTSS